LMSEDAEVGLVVLFSYDCLVHTHRLLCDHFNETATDVVIDISHPSYVVLIHALQEDPKSDCRRQVDLCG
jgi:hypothetical protein